MSHLMYVCVFEAEVIDFFYTSSTEAKRSQMMIKTGKKVKKPDENICDLRLNCCN